MLSMFENDLIVIENGIVCLCKNKNRLEISFPPGTEAIADGVFSSCTNLTSVNCPPTLTKIGDHAFEDCSSLSEIDLSLFSIIGEYAFSGCTALQEIAFSDKIGYVCNGIFLGCTGLQEITLPENIAYIGCECFKDCTSLSKVDLGEVREIDNNAFEHCRDLCMLHLPKSLFHIGPNAFSFCSSLTTVTAQNRFMDIDETAFENTVNLIFKAVQFSTSFEYAQTQGYRFKPTVNEERYRKVTSEQVSALKQKGIMFQMKVLSAEEAVIRYDEGQRMMIESIIGKPTEKKEGDR